MIKDENLITWAVGRFPPELQSSSNTLYHQQETHDLKKILHPETCSRFLYTFFFCDAFNDSWANLLAVAVFSLRSQQLYVALTWPGDIFNTTVKIVFNRGNKICKPSHKAYWSGFTVSSQKHKSFLISHYFSAMCISKSMRNIA